nr:hypothetical protein [Tanacetum cinerariifolium]
MAALRREAWPLRYETDQGVGSRQLMLLKTLKENVLSGDDMHYQVIRILPILNLNEFDMWKMRIEQYFLMTDYSLWEVILNHDSPAPTRVINGVLHLVAPIIVEHRLARKNKLKARDTLLMALPDKHQLKFNTHKDAKTLMEAIEKKFGGNTKAKKVQKTLLKQQYENFTGSNSESLDQIHDRLQKLISQLEILEVSLSQEDIYLKFLKSLPSDWRTQTLIWRNKTDLEEQSLDDLFNILKIYEAEVKSSSTARTSTQNIAFVSSTNTDSTNEPVSAATSVSTVSATILVSSLPNIDADDLEEMDLKWQMAMLTVRARQFLQRTGRNLGANRPTSMGFDMSKVECYNCYRKGHFARECRPPKDTRRNDAAEPQRRNVPVDTSTSNALVSQCDGVGSYDRSFQAEEEPTNYALMTFSSSSSFSDNEVVSYSKACTKAYAQLQYHYDKLTVDYRKSQFDVISYQTGLESVEARLLVYQQNESLFEKDIKLLKLENLSKLLASQTNDKTDLGYNSQVFTHAMFDCDDYLSSRSDESLPPSPIYDRYHSGNGYHVVPPPYTGTFVPPKPDLVFTTVPNDVETDHPAFTVKLSPTKPDQDLSYTLRPSAPIIEDWVSDSEDESKTKSPQNVPSFVHPTEQVKSPRPSIQHVEISIPSANPKTAIPKTTSHGKCKNRKACFVCKSLDYLIKDYDYHEKKMAQPTARNHAQRGIYKQYAHMTLHSPQRHVVPAAVLTQSTHVPIIAFRPVTTDVPKTSVTRPRQAKIVVTKPNSPPRRHIHCSPSPKASNFPSKVTAAKASMVNDAKDKGVIDSGYSRHMTWNMSYLSDFEELNGGYVAFEGNPKGGKIYGKDQTVSGKDSSNPLMVDNLPKIFWTTVDVKKVNDVIRLQALVDKKKVVITEASIRDALRLVDAEGIECLLNEEIFAELARIYEKPSTKLTFYKAFFSSQLKFLIHTILQCMSAKRTSWNEFSSSMASVVICLSKGKGFSGVKTPVFEGMIVEQQVDKGDAEVNVDNVSTAGVTADGDVSAANVEVPTVDEEPSIPSPTPPTPLPQPSQDIPSTSQDKIAQALEITMLKQRVKKLERKNKERMIADMDADADIVLKEAKDVVADIVKDVQDADVKESTHDQGRKAESQAKIYKIDLEHANKVLSTQEEEIKPAEVQEVVDVVTTAKIIIEVVTAASNTITAASINITAADAPIPVATLTAVPSRLTAAPRRRKGVVIRDPKEYTTSSIILAEAKSKDKGKGILQALKRKPQIEAQAKKNMMIYLKNKTKEHIDEEESKALKRLNETQAEKASKRQKLDEEVEELKRHLQIVPNEKDDVYTEATHLALKVLGVDYEIYNEHNKPYYKIKRADGSHQLYLSFQSLLRNFDREDLEAFWRLFKERFATTKPKNFFDGFLLTTLGTMFEKPDIHSQIWKNQRSVHGQAKVKS